MMTRDQWRAFEAKGWVQTVELVVGILLIIASPLAGVIPGPGGIFVLALGLAMVLRTSRWARRRYVAFKKWQPKAGRWTDWGMRRKSALRREALAKEKRAAERTALEQATPILDPSLSATNPIGGQGTARN